MFEKQRKLRLIKRLRILEKDISNLKNKLNDANEKKESWFKNKEDFKKEISKLINKAKEIKVKKDNFNENVKKLKDQRNKYNREVGDLISKVGLLSRERSEALKKFNLRLSTSKIKDKIDALEQQIETEVVSFKTEQKIMKQIKKLKDSYNKSAEIKKIMEKIDQFSNEIESSKNKADFFHKIIQEQAKLNQNGYEEFIDTSKRINELKAKQEQAFKKFLEFKRIFVQTNSLLKNKLIENSKLKQEYNKIREYLERKNKDKKTKILEEKSKNVEEKLKKKQKLTTEDLLVFQEKEGKDEQSP